MGPTPAIFSGVLEGGALSVERGWVSWRGGGCHGEGMGAMERGWVPWRGGGYHGEGVGVMKRGWVSWKGGGCHGEIEDRGEEKKR